MRNKTSILSVIGVIVWTGWISPSYAQDIETQPDSLHLRPSWSFQLDSSLGTLQGSEQVTATDFKTVTALGLRFQYQPTFLQLLGVFSLGPSFYIFPFASVDAGVSKTPATWAIGGEARYQFRFLHKQWIVPTVSFNSHYLTYKLADGSSGRTMVRGPSYGAMFLLNGVDPSIARDFYQSYGALRTYVLAEMRTYEGNDSQVIFSGKSLFFGLRIEY